jgi:hypothetical protein
MAKCSDRCRMNCQVAAGRGYLIYALNIQGFLFLPLAPSTLVYLEELVQLGQLTQQMPNNIFPNCVLRPTVFHAYFHAVYLPWQDWRLPQALTIVPYVPEEVVGHRCGTLCSSLNDLSQRLGCKFFPVSGFHLIESQVPAERLWLQGQVHPYGEFVFLIDVADYRKRLNLALAMEESDVLADGTV